MPFSSEILSIDISRLALEFIAGGENVTTPVSVSCFVPFIYLAHWKDIVVLFRRWNLHMARNLLLILLFVVQMLFA